MLKTVDEFKYKKLSPEEREKKKILGQLVGVIADFKNPTRNGRLYSEELWENVFNDPIMKEKIENKSCFGELGHPADRAEVDPEKIAIRLEEVPQKNSNGQLIGLFSILDTPNGRILKALCDSGCKIGVSSRGEGDVNMDYQGNEVVDPNSYVCECWDAVLVPSVEAARLSLVESYKGSPNDYKGAIREEIGKAKPKDRKVMLETLNALNIDISDKQRRINTRQSSAVVNSKADDNIIDSLNESVRQNAKLQKQVKELTEQLSVCNAKVSRVKEQLEWTKQENKELRESLEDADNVIDGLNCNIDERDKVIESQKSKLIKFSKQVKSNQALKESYSQSAEEVQSMQEELNKLRGEVSLLQNALEDEKQNSIIQSREFSKKYSQLKEDLNKRKTDTIRLRDKYIDSKAKMLGISSADYKRRLGEHYKLSDIDRVYDEISENMVNMKSLPFSNKKVTQARLTEAKSPSVKIINKGISDDIDGDEMLSFLAGTRLNK